MVPPALRANASTWTAAPEDAEEVRAALAEHEANPDGGILVTPEELDRWAETGEPPEHLCASSVSRPAT